MTTNEPLPKHQSALTQFVRPTGLKRRRILLILSKPRSEAIRAAKRAGAIVHRGPSAKTTATSTVGGSTFRGKHNRNSFPDPSNSSKGRRIQLAEPRWTFNANCISVAVMLTAVLLSTGTAAAEGPPSQGGVVGGIVGGLPEAPPPPPSPGGPVRVGGNIKPPTRIKQVNPVYPAIAQSARVQGVVIIEATIGENGLVTNAKVLRSIPLLDQAALDAVRQWQYEPTRLAGVPVAVILTATVQFTLSDEAVARDCSLEENLRSADLAAPLRTSIFFENHTGQTRKLYWLDTTGHRVFDSTIEKESKLEKATTVGHAWVVATEADQCVSIYLATPGAKIATLRSPQTQPLGVGSGIGLGIVGGASLPGAGVTSPRLLKEVRPQYTREAMVNKIEGTVWVQAVVLPDGTVGNVQVTRSLDGRYGLDEAAVKAAKQWRFEPGTRNGSPVPVLVTIELVFKL